MIGTLGGPELILILVIALIVFGPRKLPDIGKSIGRMMVEFRKASTEFKRTVEQEVEAEKRRPAPQLEKPRPTTGLASPEARPVGSEPAGDAVPGPAAGVPTPRPPQEGRPEPHQTTPPAPDPGAAQPTPRAEPH
jgi:sec-independent protein translocase protein TatB